MLFTPSASSFMFLQHCRCPVTLTLDNLWKTLSPVWSNSTYLELANNHIIVRENTVSHFHPAQILSVLIYLESLSKILFDQLPNYLAVRVAHP